LFERHTLLPRVPLNARINDLCRQRDVPADQQAAVDKALAEFTKTLQVYEGILGKQKFLAGDVSVLRTLWHSG
jgi:glutathione S-transferase